MANFIGAPSSPSQRGTPARSPFKCDTPTYHQRGLNSRHGFTNNVDYRYVTGGLVFDCDLRLVFIMYFPYSIANDILRRSTVYWKCYWKCCFHTFELRLNSHVPTASLNKVEGKVLSYMPAGHLIQIKIMQWTIWMIKCWPNILNLIIMWQYSIKILYNSKFAVWMTVPQRLDAESLPRTRESGSSSS